MLRLQMAKFGESTNEERAEDEPTRSIHVEVGRQPSVCPAVSPHRAGYRDGRTEGNRAATGYQTYPAQTQDSWTGSDWQRVCSLLSLGASVGALLSFPASSRSLSIPLPRNLVASIINLTVSSWPSRRLCLASPAPEAHNSARSSTVIGPVPRQ